MSTPINPNDQEIDMGEFKKRMSGAVNQFGFKIYQGIRFIIKNSLILLILCGLGFGLGYFLDKKVKTYKNEVIVIPNFGSVDYLYTKINELDAKMKKQDTAFLKSIGLTKTKIFNGIEIEPIVEVFPLMQRNEYNIEVLRLLSENQDIKRVVEESATSKNYTFHRITFETTKPVTKENSVNVFLNYVNENDYFKLLQKEYLKNVDFKLKANERTIAQIDGVLDMFATYENGSKGSNMVYYNNQLNDVIVSKERLIRENGYIKLELVASDKIVKESSLNLNVEDLNSLNGKMKIIVPIVFVLSFLILLSLYNLYRNYSSKTQN